MLPIKNNSSPRTRAGSVSAQCIQALRKVVPNGPSPLSSVLDLDYLTPLVPQGYTQSEQSIREWAWMRSFGESVVLTKRSGQ